MISGIIFCILSILISFVILKKYYKKCESFTEKMFFISFSLMLVFISIIYFLDVNNIPTLLHWTNNINNQNWLNNILMIASMVFAEVIGGLILIFVTKMQIGENNEFNTNRDKEERRINNMPLLTYSFLDYYTDGDNIYPLKSIYNNDHNAEIVLKIKNIGMNAIRKCYIKIKSKSLSDVYCVQLDTQSSLDKGEEKTIDFLIDLPTDIYDFEITIYYEDLLHNWYNQKIELNYEITHYSKGLNNYVKYNYKVSDEKEVKKPSLKTNLKKYRI